MAPRDGRAERPRGTGTASLCSGLSRRRLWHGLGRGSDSRPSDRHERSRFGSVAVTPDPSAPPGGCTAPDTLERVSSPYSPSQRPATPWEAGLFTTAQRALTAATPSGGSGVVTPQDGRPPSAESSRAARVCCVFPRRSSAANGGRPPHAGRGVARQVPCPASSDARSVLLRPSRSPSSLGRNPGPRSLSSSPVLRASQAGERQK